MSETLRDFISHLDLVHMAPHILKWNSQLVRGSEEVSRKGLFRQTCSFAALSHSRFFMATDTEKLLRVTRLSRIVHMLASLDFLVRVLLHRALERRGKIPHCTGDPIRNWPSFCSTARIKIELLFSAVVAQESSAASTNSL